MIRRWTSSLLATVDQLAQFEGGFLRDLLLRQEVLNLLAGDEGAQLLQHFLALGSEGGLGVDGGLVALGPGLEVEGLRFDGLEGGEAEEGLRRGGDVFGLLADVALAEPVEEAVDFWGEFLEFCLILDDGDFEVAGRDFAFGGFGGEEGDGLADEVNLAALLAVELDLEFPVAEADDLV